jgi:rare lipoprotein A
LSKPAYASVKLWSAAAVLALASACSSAPSSRSSPGYYPLAPPVAPAAVPGAVAPAPEANTSQGGVPDAVPRVEERSRNGNPAFYVVAGRRYVVLQNSTGFVERGVASWYGPGFHGVNTAMGEPYDMYAMTAAHPTLPIPCYARITNLSNGRSVVVRINDRGPFVANRIIDLSFSAAQRLDMVRTGTAFVTLEVLSPGSPTNVANDSGTVLNPAATQDAAAGAAGAGAAGTGPANTGGAAGGGPADTPQGAASQSPPPSQSASQSPSQAPAPYAAPPPQRLFVQVGAYGDAANAERVVRRLRASGFDGVGTSPTTANGHTLQRVRVGPVTTVQAFDALVARLATLGFNNARLAQEND